MQSAVHPAVDGVEVGELPNAAGKLRRGLKFPVLDEGRSEALFVLDLHRVEHAAVGIKADEEFVLRLEILGPSGLLVAMPVWCERLSGQSQDQSISIPDRLDK